MVDEEVPVIDADRRWDEVRLPPPMTEAEFDQVNHATLSSHWRKVARIVTDVVHKCERIGLTITTK